MHMYMYMYIMDKNSCQKRERPLNKQNDREMEIGAFAMQIHAKQQLILQAVFSRLPRLHSLPYALPSITCYSESCV